MRTHILILRRFAARDSARLLLPGSVDSFLDGGLPFPASAEEGMRFAAAALREQNVFTVQMCDSGEIVGWIAVMPVDGAQTLPEKEIRCIFARNLCGYGYVTAAMRCIVRELLHCTPLRRLIARESWADERFTAMWTRVGFRRTEDGVFVLYAEDFRFKDTPGR